MAARWLTWGQSAQQLLPEPRVEAGPVPGRANTTLGTKRPHFQDGPLLVLQQGPKQGGWGGGGQNKQRWALIRYFVTVSNDKFSKI